MKCVYISETVCTYDAGTCLSISPLRLIQGMGEGSSREENTQTRAHLRNAQWTVLFPLLSDLPPHVQQLHGIEL